MFEEDVYDFIFVEELIQVTKFNRSILESWLIVDVKREQQLAHRHVRNECTINAESSSPTLFKFELVFIHFLRTIRPIKCKRRVVV